MKDTIYTRFHKIAMSQPQETAVIDKGKRYTYQDIDAMAVAMQNSFPTESPAVVGVIMNHGARMIASLLAVSRAGAAFVNIEPSQPKGRIEFMLKESGADFVITDYPEKVKNIEVLTPAMSRTVASCHFRRPVQGDASSIAYILYTSGTTGRPKGIKVTNANVCNYAEAFEEEFKINADDVMLQYSVSTFDIFIEEVFATLLNGAALAIPSAQVRSDIRELMRFVEESKVTIISGFPYLLQDINDNTTLPSCVRLLISGGDVLRESYISKLKDKVVIYNTYGPSETTVCATYQRCDNISPLPDGTYPIGHPIKGVKVHILDEKMAPVADGEIGEICIIGAGVSQGYIGDRPEQKAFVRFPDGRTLYRSGDIGFRRADGSIVFLHRKDSQVMIWGQRVECNEVENVLCECAGVLRAVVRPMLDSNGLAHLVAYVVPKSLKGFSLKRVKDKIGNILSSFMIPEFFVKMAELPLTPNGKVDEHKLATIPIA